MVKLKENQSLDQHKIEVAAHKKQVRFLGTLRPRRGQKIFKLTDGQVSEVKNYHSISLMADSKKRQIRVKKGSYYIAALNKKNAIRKFTNLGFYE